MITTVSIITLGCKVNYTDSEEIAKALIDRGYRVIHGRSPADLSIINTCIVTARADYQSRQAVRRAGTTSPGAPVVVTGCAAAVAPDRVEREESVAAVVCPEQKGTIGDIVESLIGAPAQVSPPPVGEWRTRAFLKIQEGCNAHCTYCIVPTARGAERSIPQGRVLKGIEDLVGRGYKEIVLVGIHLGRYGDDLSPSVGIAPLLESIAAADPPVRIRLSSIEPTELTDELLSVMETRRIIAPHIHIPLQSGDDDILTAMGRPYSRRTFERLILSAARRLDNPAVGVDVMVGFPGEGDREFKRTTDLILDLPITYVHVFPFSRRPKTPAFFMGEQVHGGIKKERARIAREIGKRKKDEYIDHYVGKTVTVLTEKCEDGLVSGKSENYLDVYLPGGPDDINHFIPVNITRRFRDGVYGSRSL